MQADINDTTAGILHACGTAVGTWEKLLLEPKSSSTEMPGQTVEPTTEETTVAPTTKETTQAPTVAPTTKETTQAPTVAPTTKETTQAPETTKTPETTKAAETTKQETTSQCPTWNASTIYVGKDYVSYKGHVYRAKWWTRGDNPEKSGQWDVWQLIK